MHTSSASSGLSRRLIDFNPFVSRPGEPGNGEPYRRTT